MTASPSLPERQALFGHTTQGMGRKLESVKTPGQMFSALRWGLDQLDRTLAETPASVRAKVACRAGCSHCCHVPVDVQAHEVFFTAEFIQLNFTPDDLATVIERTGMHRASILPLTSEERSLLMQQCPLLDADGSCSVYEGRPEICRAHHASDAAVCAAAQQPDDFNPVHIPELQARMFAVMLGLDEAIEGAGYDDRAYDFGSALNEALTNSLCLARWMRHERAFPDSCLAEREGS